MVSLKLMARDGYYCAYAIGSATGSADLTAWDNAQAALVVGELNAMDWFYSANINPRAPMTQRANPMTAAHYQKRITTGKTEGTISNTHYLQTGILTYAVMGKCTTTEATPNTHAITKSTVTNPIYFAMHYEKEGTSNSRRWDFMGWVPQALDIYVSERSTIAFQTLTGKFGYSGTGSNLAQPGALTQVIHAPYTWFHTKNASGATEFTYNTGDLNLDLTEIHMHIGWADTLWGALDSDGFNTEAWVVPPFNCYVDIGARRTDAADTDIDTLIALDHASYAGDLDFILDFYESATRYLRYTWDDMYIPKESYTEVFPDESTWYEGVRFRLEFRNETSSLAVSEKNALNNDYYENP
jgi:hypothetical protein